MNEQRNLIIAFVLAAAVMFGFNFFYEAPRQAAGKQQQIATQNSVENKESSVSAPVVSEPVKSLSHADALAKTPRLQINGDRIQGSINLTGGRFDDITLTNYKETTDKNSPAIKLLEPRETDQPYFVDFGWLSTQKDVVLPTATTQWTAKASELKSNQAVTLTWNNGQGLDFERKIELDDKYMFHITDKVTNTTKAAVQLNAYGQINRIGTPKTGGYMILHEGPIGVLNGKLIELDYSKLKDKGPQEQSSTNGWLGFTDKYWLVSLIPDQKTTMHTRFKGQTIDGVDRYQTEMVSPEMTVAPGESLAVTTHLFAGAKILRMLDEYEAKLGFNKFDLAVDFGWFYFLTKPLFYFLEYLNGLIGNLGIAILVMTVLFKLALFPLANKSYRSMSRMKLLQPKMEQLKARYGNDKMRLNQELMDLYKKENANPMSGCLPILIQAPVFFCLYKVLFVTLEMRHAPFYGWINDLSAPDPTSLFNLFGLLPFTPPSFLMIGLWPIIMGLTMFLQQRLNPQPADPAQAKAFMIMPVMITFLLASFPAGLVIYWAWNNLLSIAQQWTIMRLESVKKK